MSTTAEEPAEQPMTVPEFLPATREFYDTVAVDYAEYVREDLASRPLERALLDSFAEHVRGSGAGALPVAELGCGPGRVTGYLAGSRLSVFGVDLSPRMIELARRTYPGLRFEVGSMTALDLPDGALGGIVAWYSLIHTPPERLPEVLAELHRVLAPGGHLLTGFQVGDEPLHLDRPFGHPVSLDFHRWQPEEVAALLGAAGLEVRTRVVREPEEGERTPQAFLLARKPVGES